MNMVFIIPHALFFFLAFSRYVESYKNPNDEILVGQRDRFWRHHSQEKTLILGDQDYYQSIETCLNKKLPDDFEEQLKESDSIKPTVGNRLIDETGTTGTIYLVQIENAFSEPYVNAVQTLASCIRENIPFLTEKRPLYKEFGFDDDSGLGGNNPTVLQPILSIFFPEVVEKMQNTLELAYESAGWVALSKKEEVLNWPRLRTHPHPSKVGMRVSETFNYNGFPSLAEHDDGASCAYTVNFSLSDPEDYEGGYFFITDYNGNRHFVKPNKYSCTVFLGGLYKHGVTEIKSGFREMFSTEYWPYPDAPLGNTLWKSIPESMEEYIRICNAQQDAQGKDFKYCTAKFPEKGEYSINEVKPIEKEPYFEVPKSLEPGEMAQILWRNDDGKDTTIVDGDAYVIGLPEQLLDEFHKYVNKSGILRLAYETLYEDPLIDPSVQTIYTTKDNHKWSLMGTTWKDNDMIYLDPGNEKTFESLITVLRNGDFDLVLDSIGKKFQLDGLMIHGIGIISVSQFFGESLHVDISGSRGSFYTVVVPLYLPPNNSAKILVGESDAQLNPENAAPINLEYDVGLVLGGDTVHGTFPCDYRPDQFRLSVAIYLADINEDNVDLIASDATSLFPIQHDEKWFFSQRGRFWSASDKRKSLKTDTGRRSYDVQDFSDECQAEKHLCETDLKGMRLDCPRTCEVYMEEDSYRSLFEFNFNKNSTKQDDVCELEQVKENTEKSL